MLPLTWDAAFKCADAFFERIPLPLALFLYMKKYKVTLTRVNFHFYEEKSLRIASLSPAEVLFSCWFAIWEAVTSLKISYNFLYNPWCYFNVTWNYKESNSNGRSQKFRLRLNNLLFSMKSMSFIYCQFPHLQKRHIASSAIASIAY